MLRAPSFRAVLAVLAAAALVPSVAQAQSSVTVVNPDAYSCPYPGYVDFEQFPDQTDLSAETFPGIEFTTTGGFTWRVGDWNAGTYNGKYPSGIYTSQGSRWAWLGIQQGSGRIELTLGDARVFSLLVSANTSMYLDAYDDDGHLLETAGPSDPNTGTGTMTELRIERPTADIGYVVVHDSGNYFAVDSVCSDAPGVAAKDTDGDGLPDDWELHGVDTNGDGVVDLNLPAMGADPNHKDLFVEADWLTKDDFKIGPFNFGGGWDARPSTAAAKRVTAAFNGWPVPNPNGSPQGIHLHLDAGPDSIMNPVTGATWGSLSRANAIRNGSPPADWSQLDPLRDANVESARRAVFHYVLYVHSLGCDNGSCTTGISRGIPGHDLLLAKGPDGVNTDTQEAVTLAHELGHNLGLGHGGRERTDDPSSRDVNQKANYLSIMNYYYSNKGLVTSGGVDGIIQFSPQELAPLATAGLDESAGLDPDPFGHFRSYYRCDNSGKSFDDSPVQSADGWSSIDWNCDGKIENGSANSYLQNPADVACVDKVNDACVPADGSQVLGSDDYDNLHFWGVSRGWAARNAAMVSFAQPGTAEPTIAQAKRDGLWWPSKSLTAPNEVAIGVYPHTGRIRIPLTLGNPGPAAFAIRPQLDAPRPWLSLPSAAPLTLAQGASPSVSLTIDTRLLKRKSTVEGTLDYLDTDGSALGDSHLTVTVANVGDPSRATCAVARSARRHAGLPAVQAPGLDAFLRACRQRPAIHHARMARRRFAIAHGRTAVKARSGRGTAFVFTLSKRARTSIAVEQRRASRHCKRRGHRAAPRRCVRTVTLVTLLRAHTHAGRNRVAFSGRFRRRLLRPGAYLARLQAVDPVGNRSKPVTLRFTVVRG